MAPPWVAPPTERDDKSDESKNPLTGAKFNIRENRLFGVFCTIVEVLKRIYVVKFFGASLSTEGRMATTSWAGRSLNVHATTR